MIKRLNALRGVTLTNSGGVVVTERYRRYPKIQSVTSAGGLNVERWSA